MYPIFQVKIFSITVFLKIFFDNVYMYAYVYVFMFVCASVNLRSIVGQEMALESLLLEL